MDFTTSDHIRLNLRQYGSGQPIIMIHGFSGCQAIWTEQIRPFVNHGFQVITYDQRNHGASELDENLTEIDRLVTDLKEIVEQVCNEKPILIGHSMGAAVTYGMLEQNAHLLKGVIAIDESPKMIENTNWHYGFMHATRANYKEKMRQLPHIRQTLHGVTPECRKQVKAENQQFPFDWQANEELLYSHVRRDWRQFLIDTMLPVLMVTANQSPFFDGEYAKVMQAQNPEHLHRRAIDQTGHCVMAEQPAKFNQTAFEFISTLK